MMDIELALMAGTDIPLPELQLAIHQPQIKEIAMMGERDFFRAAQYLCLQKEDLVQDKTVISDMSNFQVLMKVIEQQKTSDMKIAILTLLTLIFPMRQPNMTKNSILLTDFETGDTKIIDENNFDMFQNVLGKILCINSMFQGDNVVYNPANAAAQKIADKIMAGRRKVAEIKNKESSGSSILGRYVSILTIGLPSMSLQDSLSLTIYQMFDLMDRFELWLNWDIDIRARMAGAKPEKEAENWMKNIH